MVACKKLNEEKIFKWRRENMLWKEWEWDFLGPTKLDSLLLGKKKILLDRRGNTRRVDKRFPKPREKSWKNFPEHLIHIIFFFFFFSIFFLVCVFVKGISHLLVAQ